MTELFFLHYSYTPILGNSTTSPPMTAKQLAQLQECYTLLFSFRYPESHDFSSLRWPPSTLGMPYHLTPGTRPSRHTGLPWWS